MSASCLSYNISTRAGVYSIVTASELQKLPTTNTFGKQELENCSPCVSGSTCNCISTGATYVLNGDTNMWEVSKSSGGGSGDSGVNGLLFDDTTDTLYLTKDGSVVGSGAELDIDELKVVT